MDPLSQGGEASSARREALDAIQSARAARQWWDRDSAAYLDEHANFLDGALVWGPEGLTELETRLLGLDLDGLRVLEVGCGAAAGSAWLASQGAFAVGLDVSGAMLAAAATRDEHVPLVHASGDRLPFVPGSFDAVVSAHGALAFMGDLHATLREVRRVLRDGGLLVFSVTHPVRWAFPDDPGIAGLTATMSYFDRRAYVERDSAGNPVYVEHHRTMGDTVMALVETGFSIEGLIEPEWPSDNEQTWGAWSPLRGGLLPGTAIWSARAINSSTG
ncbi:MAG: methyltransferase domain-containing protein [Actinomycetes bacterium]